MSQPEVEYEEMTHSELRAYLKRLEVNLAAVRRRLKRFEAQFGSTTDAMFARLRPEEIEASADLSEWAGEREVLQRLEAQRDELAERLK